MADDKRKNDELTKQDNSEQKLLSHGQNESCGGHAPCVYHNREGVFVASRYISGIVACATMVIFCTFMVGFFAGKRFVVQSFLDKTAQDSFSDQVYASLCALIDKEIETGASDDEADDGEETTEQEGRDGDDDAGPRIAAMSAIDTVVRLNSENLTGQKQDDVIAGQNRNEQDEQEQIEDEQGRDNNVVSSERYYAQLVGFSTLRAAQKCAQRLYRNGFEVEVKKRVSKSAQGKRIAWYQVISCLYDNKRELEKFVDRIMQQEKIKDIKITSVY